MIWFKDHYDFTEDPGWTSIPNTPTLGFLPMRTPATSTGPECDQEGASGLIFNISAKMDVELVAIHVGHFKTPNVCEIWAYRGDDGYETSFREGSAAGWQQVANANYYGPDHESNRIPLSAPMPIKAGKLKAFYLHAPSSRLVAATDGSGVNAEDDAVAVSSGDCAQPEQWSRFNVTTYDLAGAVEYTVTSQTAPCSTLEPTPSTLE